MMVISAGLACFDADWLEHSAANLVQTWRNYFAAISIVG
jgi:6-phosphogluconate dehydrogenase